MGVLRKDSAAAEGPGAAAVTAATGGADLCAVSCEGILFGMVLKEKTKGRPSFAGRPLFDRF